MSYFNDTVRQISFLCSCEIYTDALTIEAIHESWNLQVKNVDVDVDVDVDVEEILAQIVFLYARS